MTQNNPSPPAPVALISMPWASIGRPNAALGIIKSMLTDAGIRSEVHYPCIEFACSLGFGFYGRLAALEVWPFLGEWLFSRAAFGQDAVGKGPGAVEEWIPHDGVRENLVSFLGNDFAERLSELRETIVPEYCERLAERFANRAVLGFSCTFNQLVPAIALARAIKRLNPDIKILLGGPQCEGIAGKELMRNLPWLDAIFEGEFEVGGVDAVRWALGELDEPPAQYVSHRSTHGNLRLSTEIAVLQDMNLSPMPDYDEFYAAAEGVQDSMGQAMQIGTMPFESARGCWWGQRRHCTFCGLNGGLMRFRSKSPDRVLKEVLALASRHHQISLAAVDNIIDLDYLKTLLPRLREMNLGLEFFYETKANLKRDEVRLYRDAGVSVIQPGIESFSSHVLDLMHKGVSALRNIYLLKLCRQYGITPVYNILLGFPGETVEDHRLQTEWMKRMHHILPPTEACRFALQRHSPMHNDHADFGLTEVRPSEGYQYVFPPELLDMEKIAFYFDFKQQESNELTRAQKKVVRCVKRWKARWSKGAREPELIYRNAGEFVLVIDGRSTQTPRKHILRDLSRDILLACDDPMTIRKLVERLGVAATKVESTVATLGEMGLVLREGDMVLSLVIPHSKRSQLPFVPSSLPNQDAAYLREKKRSVAEANALIESTASGG